MYRCADDEAALRNNKLDEVEEALGKLVVVLRSVAEARFRQAWRCADAAIGCIGLQCVVLSGEQPLHDDAPCLGSSGQLTLGEKGWVVSGSADSGGLFSRGKREKE